jgi:hypothetical protein
MIIEELVCLILVMRFTQKSQVMQISKLSEMLILEEQNIFRKGYFSVVCVLRMVQMREKWTELNLPVFIGF